MKRKIYTFIRFSKLQRVAILILMLGLLSLELFVFFYDTDNNDQKVFSIPEEFNQAQILASNSLADYTQKRNYQDFNPNDLNAEQWGSLGFSPKQAASILKYKKSLGGKFHSKTQIKNCFVISDEKFAELEPYIMLPNKANSDEKNQAQNYFKVDTPKIAYKKFNPNNYKEEDWVSIGFSPKQAASILKYKKSLGGKFKTIEQIQASYVISDKKFQEMKPYIDLPSKPETKPVEKSQETQPEVVVTKPLEKFNPNDLTHEQWMELGFTEKQASTIMNFKRSLGGKFKDAQTLKKCYSISEEKFNELSPYLVFE